MTPPILFREHRGGYEESLQTSRVVTSLEEVRALVPSTKGRLVCDYYGYNYRSGWNEWIVQDERGPLGFSNQELK
jgi:hypothetical protein